MKPIEVDCWEEEASGKMGQIPPLLGDIGFELAFATPDLALSPLLADVRVFAVRFYAEGAGPSPPEYAPLFALFLERLMGEEYEVCLSLPGAVRQETPPSGSTPVQRYIIPLENWLVDQVLLPRGLWYTALVLPGASYPFGRPYRGNGFSSLFFFRCPQDLVRPILLEYWDAINDEMEGYVMPQETIPLLHEWNLRERDAGLFHEVMDTAFVAVRSFGDRDGLLVITRKLNLEEFRQRVGLDDPVEVLHGLLEKGPSLTADLLAERRQEQEREEKN